MLLRHSFGMTDDAALIEQACVNVLKNGLEPPISWHRALRGSAPA